MEAEIVAKRKEIEQIQASLNEKDFEVLTTTRNRIKSDRKLLKEAKLENQQLKAAYDSCLAAMGESKEVKAKNEEI